MLHFYGCTLDEPRIGVVTEFCPNGDLRDYISDIEKPRLNTRGKLRICREIADVMSHLNEHEIVHRDLKSDNVLLTEFLIAKLIDFGISKAIQSSSVQAYMTKQAGTSQYMAPEVTLSSSYGAKCDVFSYGIMLFEIFTEDFMPYGKFPEFNIELKVALNPEFRPKIEDNDFAKCEAVEWLVDLMKRSWSNEVDERPDFGEIKEEIENCMEETVDGMEEFDELMVKKLDEQRILMERIMRKEEDMHLGGQEGD